MSAPDLAGAKPERVLLIGMMGAGKTTVGRILAGRLGWAYLDSDAQVETATGMTVPQLFQSQGEPAFREEEAAAVRRALEGDVPVVVSVAGGAVLDPATRRRMAGSGTIVWLRARPQTLAARVGDGVGRPLLDGDPLTALEGLDAVRRPLYAQLADLTVDVDGHDPLDVASEVLRQIWGDPAPDATRSKTAGGRS